MLGSVASTTPLGTVNWLPGAAVIVSWRLPRVSTSRPSAPVRTKVPSATVSPNLSTAHCAVPVCRAVSPLASVTAQPPPACAPARLGAKTTAQSISMRS